MVSLEKRKFLTPLQKLLKNVGELGKLIVAKGFEKLPKIQKIAKSGHTAQLQCSHFRHQRFKSRHWQIFSNFFTVNCIEKAKIGETEAKNGPLEKNYISLPEMINKKRYFIFSFLPMSLCQI